MRTLAHRSDDLNSRCPKRKRPWGAGVFRSSESTWGSWVFHILTWRLWGADKEPREFTKSSADHRHVRACQRHRLAGLDDACGLGIAVVRINGASRDAEPCHRDTRDERHDHNLEVGRAICAVDRMVHGGLLLPSSRPLANSSFSFADGFNLACQETWGFGFRFLRGDHKAVIRLEIPRLGFVAS